MNKPFGVSCVGYKQKNGGVFPESRFDRKNANEEDTDDDIQRVRHVIKRSSIVSESIHFIPYSPEQYRLER